MPLATLPPGGIVDQHTAKSNRSSLRVRYLFPFFLELPFNARHFALKLLRCLAFWACEKRRVSRPIFRAITRTTVPAATFAAPHHNRCHAMVLPRLSDAPLETNQGA